MFLFTHWNMPSSGNFIEFSTTELARYPVINWLTCLHWWIKVRGPTASSRIIFRTDSLSELHALKFPFRNLLLSTGFICWLNWLLFSCTSSRWLRLVVWNFSAVWIIFYTFATGISRLPLFFHIESLSFLNKHFNAYLWMFLICFFIKLPLTCRTLDEVRWSSHWLFRWILWGLLLWFCRQLIVKVEFGWRSFVDWAVHDSRLLRSEWIVCLHIVDWLLRRSLIYWCLLSGWLFFSWR